MGTQGLDASTWWASAPAAPQPAVALEILGDLAAVIADRLGRTPPAALPQRTVRHPWVDDAPADVAAPDALGRAWELLMMPEDRRGRGAHFTPPAVVDVLCSAALRAHRGTASPTVWDPAVGGGAFLLGMARLAHAAGEDRSSIARRLHGTDVDPVAIAVTDASLELWSGGARPTLVEADALMVDSGPFDIVVGNPPFLGQLSADTARSEERRARLTARFGDVASGYVDEAALFLLAALQAVRPGGVVTLILPESLLGSAHAEPLRRAAAGLGDLEELWVPDSPVFDAAVDVVAPLLVRREGQASQTRSGTVVTGGDGREVGRAPRPGPDSWAPLLGIDGDRPSATIPSGSGTLGDLATITAGFRQHFYGIVDAVVDDESGSGPKLVTSGAIEPFRCTWGETPVRFAGRRWRSPRVDVDAIADRSVADWFRARLVPKVLVASQTRVVEAVVDPDGSLAPSVPVVSVEPSDPDDVWRIAAVVGAPIVSAALAAQVAGTGLARGTIRVRAADLARVPLPSDRAAWDEGAALVREASEAGARGAVEEYDQAMRRFGTAMDYAYAVDDTTTGWWLAGVGMGS